MKNFKRRFAKHWWIILVILGVIGWFYWSYLRPSMIYSTCHNQAISLSKAKIFKEKEGYIINKLLEGDPLNNLPKVANSYELYYKACLRSKGINK